MSGVHDVGGKGGFDPLDPHDNGVAFHHEWEARVFAINRLLLEAHAYTLDEFRHTIELMEPDAYRSAGYYERWLYAIETLAAQKSLLHG
jgi:nitrile hydratase subunit beta